MTRPHYLPTVLELHLSSFLYKGLGGIECGFSRVADFKKPKVEPSP